MNGESWTRRKRREGDEFDDLVEDIESIGQKVPIVVHEGVLLDGRNRALACLKLGIEPIVEQYKPQVNVDPGVWILSVNLQRRSLTAEQRAMIWSKASDVMREMARARQQAAGIHGAEGGRGHKKPLPPNDGKGFSEPQTRERHARSTAGQLAAAAGISERKASEVIAVKKHAPELAEQVARGEVKLKDAVKRLPPRPSKRAAASKPKPPQFDDQSIAKQILEHTAEVLKGYMACPEGKRDEYRRRYYSKLAEHLGPPDPPREPDVKGGGIDPETIRGLAAEVARRRSLSREADPPDWARPAAIVGFVEAELEQILEDSETREMATAIQQGMRPGATKEQIKASEAGLKKLGALTKADARKTRELADKVRRGEVSLDDYMPGGRVT